MTEQKLNEAQQAAQQTIARFAKVTVDALEEIIEQNRFLRQAQMIVAKQQQRIGELQNAKVESERPSL